MNIPQFDEFIAIDWSGAARGYDGIAAAFCRRGHSAPALIIAPGRRWTRREITEWLKSKLAGRKRLLIGFDFAFGFPFESDLGYLGGRVPEVAGIFDLWELIESKSCDESDFGCLRFVNDPDYASLFWTAGTRPAEWIERKRLTEHACAAETGTRPDTLYKMLHSKQVGKASITGMRVLHHIRSSKQSGTAIWPFEKVRKSAMVEIYPTMFRKQAAGSIAKLRSLAELNAALTALGSQAMTASARTKLSDHETDALLSAAGLRSIAHLPAVWSPAGWKSRRVQSEGWIFGVFSSR
jgi:hypothetical protein